MRNAAIVALLGAALAACAGSGGRSSYEQVYAQAQSEIGVAKQMGFLWRDTEQLLADSRQAYERGDKKAAVQLAREAVEQAVLAQQQARRQSNPAVRYPQ